MTELADFLLEPWRSGLGQRALLEVALVGAIGGGLAFWVVTFGLSYGAESLAHGLLPGLVAAAILGLPLVAGAIAGIVAAAAATGVVGRDPRLGVDTATAVAVTGMLGAGGLLALAQDAPPRLEDLLFGDPLSVGAADLAATGALALVCGGALIVLHRPLVAVAFDAEAAGPLGVRRGAVLGALLALLAATLGVGGAGTRQPARARGAGRPRGGGAAPRADAGSRGDRGGGRRGPGGRRRTVRVVPPRDRRRRRRGPCAVRRGGRGCGTAAPLRPRGPTARESGRQARAGLSAPGRASRTAAAAIIATLIS